MLQFNIPASRLMMSQVAAGASAQNPLEAGKEIATELPGTSPALAMRQPTYR